MPTSPGLDHTPPVHLGCAHSWPFPDFSNLEFERAPSGPRRTAGYQGEEAYGDLLLSFNFVRFQGTTIQISLILGKSGWS
jgi:hypothetical protein